jgi:hypothetical protein
MIDNRSLHFFENKKVYMGRRLPKVLMSRRFTALKAWSTQNHVFCGMSRSRSPVTALNFSISLAKIANFGDSIFCHLERKICNISAS